MKSLSKIRSEFSEILTSMGTKGAILTILSELLSRSVYENEVNIVSGILESSSSRCLNVNSAITHAMDKGHSVNRGSNQRFLIKNVIPTETFSVVKYDTCLEYGSYKLVYDNDYQFQSGVVTSFVLILAKEVMQTTHTISSTEEIKFDIPTSDISEDISIWRVDNTNAIPMPLVRRYRDLLMPDLVTTLDSNGIEVTQTNFYPFTPGSILKCKFNPATPTSIANIELTNQSGVKVTYDLAIQSDPSNKLLCLTNSDYSVRLYNPNKFNVGDQYFIKFIPKTYETLETLSTTTVPGFILVNANKLEYELIDPVDAVVNTSQIFFDSTRDFASGFTIRSNSDLVELIKSYFSNVFDGILVKIQIASGESTGGIKVYVTGSEDKFTEEGFSESTQNLIDEFLEYVKTAYYVKEPIQFIKSEEVEVPLKLNIYYTGVLPTVEVQSVISEFEGKIGEDYNPYKLLSRLQDSSHIRYSDFIDHSYLPTVVKLSESQHVKFTDGESGQPVIVYNLFNS